MQATIEVETLCESVTLPDGLRFKDWGQGQVMTFAEDGNGQFLNTYLLAMERVSDGALATIEISQLKQIGNGILHVGLLEIAKGIEASIAKLQ